MQDARRRIEDKRRSVLDALSPELPAEGAPSQAGHTSNAADSSMHEGPAQHSRPPTPGELLQQPAAAPAAQHSSGAMPSESGSLQNAHIAVQDQQPGSGLADEMHVDLPGGSMQAVFMMPQQHRLKDGSMEQQQQLPHMHMLPPHYVVQSPQPYGGFGMQYGPHQPMRSEEAAPLHAHRQQQQYYSQIRHSAREAHLAQLQGALRVCTEAGALGALAPGGEPVYGGIPFYGLHGGPEGTLVLPYGALQQEQMGPYHRGRPIQAPQQQREHHPFGMQPMPLPPHMHAGPQERLARMMGRAHAECFAAAPACRALWLADA